MDLYPQCLSISEFHLLRSLFPRYIELIKKLDQFRIIFCAVLDFFFIIAIYAFALAQCQKALSVIF